MRAAVEVLEYFDDRIQELVHACLLRGQGELEGHLVAAGAQRQGPLGGHCANVAAPKAEGHVPPCCSIGFHDVDQLFKHKPRDVRVKGIFDGVCIRGGRGHKVVQTVEGASAGADQRLAHHASESRASRQAALDGFDRQRKRRGGTRGGVAARPAIGCAIEGDVLVVAHHSLRVRSKLEGMGPVGDSREARSAVRADSGGHHLPVALALFALQLDAGDDA
mmetsp:Transcript_173435/g.550603  ORF Transcript_173435/g.550603 Transcript_173435/m.550603 type:complete len:220 (+) Transcript_173435:643-1302(+)